MQIVADPAAEQKRSTDSTSEGVQPNFVLANGVSWSDALRSARWRRSAVVVSALCAGVVPSVNAFAHNGIGAAFKGRAGHYLVYAYDGESLPDGRLDYRLVLLNGRTKNPVYGAHPRVTATRPGVPAATGKVTTFGNVFFYNLPNPYPRDWTVHLSITGPLGAGDVRFRMHGAAAPTVDADPPAAIVTDSGSSSWPLIAGVSAGALALAAGVVYRIRRSAPRRSAAPR